MVVIGRANIAEDANASHQQEQQEFYDNQIET